MTRIKALLLLIAAFAAALSLSGAQSYGDEIGFVNSTRIAYSPESFNFVGAEKIQAVVDMANILIEKRNIIDVSSALRNGRVTAVLNDQRNMNASFSFDKPDSVDAQGDGTPKNDDMSYARAIFGRVTAALDPFFNDNPVIEEIDSYVVALSVNKISDVEEEAVVYCSNGFVQYLIDLSSGEKGFYKEARVVKYGSTEGLVVRFNESGQIELAANCRYPIAPTTRATRGVAETTSDSLEKKIIVDSSFSPEFIVNSVVSFHEGSVRVVKLDKDVPYSKELVF